MVKDQVKIMVWVRLYKNEWKSVECVYVCVWLCG